MKRFGVIGLCLMTVVALNAIAASTASAKLPEWLGTFPTKFTSHGGEAILKVGSSKIRCISTNGKGEITGAKTGLELITVSGCKFSGSIGCNSPGAGPEEVITSTLNMTLGYITKSTKDIGIAINGTGGATGNLLTEIECHEGETPLLVKIRSSIIGLLTPINTLNLTFTLNFAENATTKKQAVEKFEAEPKDTLEVALFNGVFEEGVAITEDTILTEKDLKIDA
jgi:hypothetical protein